MKINNKWDMAAARALIDRTPENSVAKMLLSDCCDEIESLQAKLTLANELLRLEKDKVRQFKKAQEAGKARGG